MSVPELPSRDATAPSGTILRRRVVPATQDRQAFPRRLMVVIGPTVPVLILVGATTGVLLRWRATAALPAVGVGVLVAAVLVGLPHGALDVELMSERRRSIVPGGLGYALLATAVYVLWWRWPSAGLAVLLVVSAVHFAASDVAVSRWRRPLDPVGGPCGLTLRGCATGVLAVAGPFAVWPAQTNAVLRQLHADALIGPMTVTSRIVSLLALATAVLPTVAGARAGDRVGAVEPWALAALVACCPPLLAFGVYFAGWHSLRQTTRLVIIHPGAARRLADDGLASAVRQLVRRAALPTAVAGAGLVAVGMHHGSATATVLAGLLAVSVPHAVVTALAECRVKPGPPQGGPGEPVAATTGVYPLRTSTAARPAC